MKKISIILFALIAVIAMSKVVYADALSDYQKQLDAIKAQQKATASQLTGLDQQIAEYMYDIMDLDSQIVEYSSKLADLQKKVDDVNSQLQEQQQALQDAAQSYNSAQDIYLTRLRVIYENGVPNMLDIFLSSQSISDFFSKVNVLNSILDYDKSLVNNMQNQKEYVDYIKNNIEIQKTQLDQLTYDTQKSSQALADARTAKQNKMNQMQSSKATLTATAAALAKQESDTQRKIQDEINRMADTGGSFSGQFAWPVPGFNLITTKFNQAYDPWNTGNYTYHTGCDISGSNIYGTPIRAIEAGTIVLAQYYGGYGNCVIIDHGTSSVDGNKYKSLYGHAERLNVVVGQKVNRGDIISYVGSTGNSTGAHLHLEIYKNNKLVDPLSYFKGMNLIYR